MKKGNKMSFKEASTETSVNGNKKLVVAPHRKRNVVWSQNPALSKIGKGMEDQAGAQIKRTKLMIEADKKWNELFLKHKADEYKAEEASKNREHELRIA